MDELSSLLEAPLNVRKEIVGAMRSMAGEVVEMIKDEMMKTEGFTWGVDMGFHAIPSMRCVLLSLKHHFVDHPRWAVDDRHLHLHIISSDRISPAMKTKKHYNSFRTDLGFFVHLSDVEEWIESDARIVRPFPYFANSADDRHYQATRY